jgi:hypothetical protein
MVQAPFSSSSFNRYSYSWNNPIKYVDPSGYYADMSDAVDDSYGDYGGYDGGFGEGRCITKGETKDVVDLAGNVHYDIQFYNIDPSGPCNQCRKKASNSHTGVSDGGGEGSSGYGGYSGPPDLGVVAPEFFLDPGLYIGGIFSIARGSIAGIGFKSFRGLSSRRGLKALSKADDFGIKSFNDLKRSIKGTGLQAHHLIEKRFADVLGVHPNKMYAIAVTKAEHHVFTSAWRKAIPYGQGTANATQQQIQNTAKQIYKDYPDILNALGL